MRITKQFTLKNFSELHSFLHATHMLEEIGNNDQRVIFTDKSVRISRQRRKCCKCSKLLSLNGTYKKSPVKLKLHGLTIHIQQMYCRNCSVSGKIERSVIDDILEETDQLATNLCILLSEAGVSQERISSILRDGLGISLTGHTVTNRVRTEIDGVEIAAPITVKDAAHYDEQFFKENGIEKARICIIPPGEPIPIYDAIHENANAETIKKVLLEIKEKYPSLKKFVMDMQPRYPNIFKEVFGQDVTIIWCLFHLNKLIFKEMKSLATIGKTVSWTLLDIASLYRSLGIFYDRENELEWVIEAENRLQQFKEFRSKQGGKRKDIDKDIKEHERALVNGFWRFVKHLKLARRRVGENLRLRSKEEALRLLDKWLKQKKYFPNILAKRLEYIKKNINKFTPALEDKDLPATNNFQEAYFSSTAQQKKKKDARSSFTFPLRIKMAQLRKIGQLISTPITLAKLLQRWHLIFTLFASPP